MKLLIKRIDGLEVPKQATDTDTGYDVIAISDPIIIAEKEDIIAPQPLDDKPTYYRRVKYIAYKTGLFVAPVNKTVSNGVKGPKAFVSETRYDIRVFPRSSVSKKQLTLANSIGLIDNGYRGEIEFRFRYHFQPADLRPIRNDKGDYELVGSVNPEAIYKKGDAIGQLVASDVTPIEFEFVEELPASQRGEGGFGSSNR
jgi:dUTPase